MPENFTGSNLLASRTRTVLTVLFCLLLAASAAAQQQPATQMQAQVAQLPLAFEPNRGQADKQVKFLSRGPGYLLLLTRDEAVLSLGGGKTRERDVVRLQLADANRNAKSTGLDQLPGKTNYFLGNNPRQWRTNVPNYGKVRYAQVYPGIDLLYYGKQNSLEHDFIVAPNADPGKIAFNVRGAKQLRVDEKGNLLLTTANGQIQLDKPFIFQTNAQGQRVEIVGGFALQGKRVSFHVGPYDKSRELVIDPVLNYASYFGGDSTTTVSAITVDATGNAYITGSTASSVGTLAGTALGTPDRDGTTKLDVFVAKLNASGSAVDFTTIIGGAGDDVGNAIAVDGSGNIYVAGQTSSGTFPTSAGAYRTVVGNVLPDGFAAKVNSTGSTLSYSTYLNGGAVATDGADNAKGIMVNADGELIVTGSTASTTFYPAGHVFGTDLTQNGGLDGFLLRLNPAGTGNSDLKYGTYWGGDSDDESNGLVIQAGNRAVIAGYTKSDQSGTAFPQGTSEPDNNLTGTQDGFVSALSTGGAFVVSITCVDNTADRRVDIVTTTPHGLSVGDSFTITGTTDSADIDFSDVNETATVTGSTTLSYQETTCNNRNGQSAGITPGTSRLVGRRNTSTYLGGTLVDGINGIAIDGTGAIYVVGTTDSNGQDANVINEGNAIQNTGLNTTDSGAATDAFVVKLAANLQAFTYSFYLGGTGNDTGTGISVNPTCAANCEVLVTGTTASAGRFTSNALQGALNGTQDGFIARVASAGTSLIYSTYFGGAGADSIAGVAGVYAGTAGAPTAAVVAANVAGTIGTPATFGAGATVSSSAAQTATDAGATGSVVVARLAANNAAAPTLTVTGNRNIDPIGQSAALTSTVIYSWTVTNTHGTNAATGVTLDVPMPQTGGNDLLTIASTNNPSACTTKVGTATQPGGMTCVFGNVAANNGTANVQVTASPTAAAACSNAPCAVPTITLTGRANGAEPSAVAFNSVVSNIVPVTNLVVTGNAVSTPGGNAIYRLGVDTSVLYTITVTNNSGATIAANDAALDVLIESVYSSDPQFVVSSVKLNTVPMVLGALVQGVNGCFNDTVNNKVQCNVTSIPAGGTAVVEIDGSFNPGTLNPAVPLLNTTSKFGAAVNSEIFTSNSNNTNVNVAVDYTGPEADLQITAFAEAADPVRTAQDVIYTVTADNAGPTDATSVTVTLTPAAPNPANVGTFTFAENSDGDGTVPVVCAQPGGAGTVINCVIANADMTVLAPAITFTVTGTLTLDANVATSNQAMTADIVTAGTTSDPNALNSTANVSTTIRREAALSVNSFSAPTTLADLANLTYTFNVSNAAADGGADSATSTVVTLSLPQNAAGATFTGNTFTNQACAGTTTVTCTIGTIPAGALNIPISVTVNPPDLAAGDPSEDFNGAITGIASANVVSVGGTKTAANITTAIQRQTTLSVGNLNDSPDPVGSTGNITYTVDVTNTGANVATNVKLDFTLTSGFTLVSPSAAVCPAIAGGLRCNVASVATGGAPTTFTLVITPSPTLIPTNQASANASASVTINTGQSTEVVDSGTGTLSNPNGTITTSVERRADLSLTGFGGEGFSATATVSSQGQITYTLALRNNGPDTATGVQVVFTLTGAGGFAFVGSTGTTGCTITGAGLDELTCTLAALASTNQTTFTATITPPAGFITVGNSATLNANAAVSGAVIDNTAGNNSRGPASTQVQRQADLALTGFVGASFTGTTPVGLASNVTFTLVTKNNGPDDATGVTVVYTLPAGFTYVSDTLGSTCTPAATTVSCPVGPITNGATTSFDLVVTPPAGLVGAGVPSATFNASATVSSANVFNTPAGNDSAGPIVITVERQSNFDVSGFSATASVSAAGTVTYPVTITNNGPDDAAAVKVAFTLNAGNTFVGTTAVNGCVVTSPTVRTCDIGTVLANGVSPVTFNLQITPSPTAVPLGNPSAVINGQVTSVMSATSIDKVGGTKTSAVGPTTVERRTDLSLSGFTATPTVSLAGNLVYGLTVSNTAGPDNATNVKVTFTITSGFQFQSTTAAGGCITASATTLECTVGNVTTGAPVAFTATVRAPAGFLGAGVQSAPMSGEPSAVFSASVVDGVTGVKSLGALITTVERQSDLSLNGFGGEGFTATAAVSTAGNITYSLAVRNNGPDNATNVTVTFDFNAQASGFAFVSTSLGGGCVISTPTQLTCTIGNLANAAQTTFTAVITPPAGFITSGNAANLTANATVLSSSLVDGTANDTRGPVSTAVQRQADLRASGGGGTAFTGPALPINSSATATYNLSVVNSGPDADDNAVVVFTFTNPLTSLNGSAGLGVCTLSTATTVTCTMPPGFAASTTRSGSITVTPNSGILLAATNSASYDVSVSISSSTAFDNGVAGAAGANNTSATVTTTVQRQADLRVVSKGAPAAVADGGPIQYVVTVDNFGPDTAGSVRVVDALAGTANAGTLTGSPTGGFTLNATGAIFTSPTFPLNSGVCTPNSGTPTAPSVTVVCMLGPMNAGQQATITITGVANIDAGVSSATFNNVARVDAAQNPGDPINGGTQTAIETNGGNNSNSVVSTTVSRSADLLMTVVNSTPVLVGGTPDPAGPGTGYVVGTHESIKYDITAANNAASATTVTNAFVQITLPITLQFTSSATGCTGPGTPGGIVTCNIAAVLTPGTSANVSFIAVPGATLPVTPSSNVNISISPSVGAPGNSDPDPSNNGNITNTTIINRVSDLGVAQAQPALPVSVTVPNGSTATYNYTWTVTNNGPSNATGVNVTNGLPTDLTFVSGSWPAVAGTGAGVCSAAGQNVTCPLSTIDSGATVTITVTVRPNLNTALASKFVANQPVISGSVQDNVGGNNNDTDSIELRGVTDLQVTIVPATNPAPAPAGEVLVGNTQTYAVTVTNNGPYPAGSVITLTNAIDASDPNVGFVGFAATGSFSCISATNCTLAALPPNTSQTVNLTTSTPANAVAPGQTMPLSINSVVTQYNNGTDISPTGDGRTDPNTANNTATGGVTGHAAADLAVQQTAPATVVVNQSGNKFAVTVQNIAGRSDATNVVLTNVITVDAPTSVSTTASGMINGVTPCNAASGLGTMTVTIVCNIGTIASGATATVDLALTPTLGGFLENVPTVTRTEIDPVPGNNSATMVHITVNTTPPGQQSFNPTDPNSGAPIPSVEISGFITIPGNTTMTVNDTTNLAGVALPVNYRFGTGSPDVGKGYTITNTATFQGNVTVCLKTPETFDQPHRARIFLLTVNPASDRTVAGGFVQVVQGGALAQNDTRQVCGVVPSLPSGAGSTYVVMEPISRKPFLDNVVVTITGGGGKGTAGTTILLDGLLATDPDSFPCMRLATLVATGTAVQYQCEDGVELRKFRWVGDFLDIQTVDPATGKKVIEKDCRRDTVLNPFSDGKPCNQALTSVGLGSQTITLTVIDENASLHPGNILFLESKNFDVGSTGAGGGGSLSQTISQGQTGTFSFSYTYGANTTFAFTGTPALAANLITCSAQPLTYTGPVGGTQTTTVTVLCSTSPPIFALNHPAKGGTDGSLLAGIVGLTGLPLLGMVLMPARSRRSRKLRMLAIFLLIGLMVVFTASCGGGGTNSFGGAPKQTSAGTPKAVYSITVTATPPPSGPAIPTLTLTVQ